MPAPEVYAAQHSLRRYLASLGCHTVMRPHGIVDAQINRRNARLAFSYATGNRWSTSDPWEENDGTTWVRFTKQNGEELHHA